MRSNMTKSRAYSWTFKSVATLFVAQAVVCVPLYANAASTSGEASVTVSLPTSVGTVSNLQVNIPNAKKKTTTAATSTTAAQTNINTMNLSSIGGGESIVPAVFSIAGLPSQTFSIVVPMPGTFMSTQGSVQFLGFVHSAGNTPTIGSSGNSQFSVGARMQYTPSSEMSVALYRTQSGPNETQDLKPNQSQGPKKFKPTLAQKAALPKSNPFRILGVQEGFMNVFVCYN